PGGLCQQRLREPALTQAAAPPRRRGPATTPGDLAMDANTDLQVWLQSQSTQPPGIVVPYVLSTSDTTLRYSIGIVSTSPAGRSEIRQGGTVWVHAYTPTPLSRISITPTGASS